MLYSRAWRFPQPPGPAAIPQRAVVHNDRHIAIWGGQSGPENVRGTERESEAHGLAVFKHLVTQAAAQLVVNKQSSRRLWRPLPFTADDEMLPSIKGYDDHELLIATYNWEDEGGCNALTRLPAMGAFPNGLIWQVARGDQTAHEVAHQLFSSSWRALHRNDFANLHVLPHSIWLRIFGAETAAWDDPDVGDQVVFINPDLNAPGTIRAIRSRSGVLNRGRTLTVPKRYLLTCTADLKALIEAAASALKGLFWPESASLKAPTSAIVAFARKMGIGPQTAKRRREFEANLKIRMKPDRKLLPCAYFGRFVGHDGVMQCASVDLCGQTPQAAAKSTPGHVLATQKRAPPCMLDQAQCWKNGVRYECALHVQAAVMEMEMKR